MSILESLNSWLPDGWTISHVIALEASWEVIIGNGEYVIVATGDEIEDALFIAADKTEDHANYTKRLFSLENYAYSAEPRPKVSLDGLGPQANPFPTIARRKLS